MNDTPAQKKQIGYWEGRKEMFYLTTHSRHFIYGYMVSDIWLRTILIVRKETRCCHMGYSFRLTARVLLYAPSHRQDSTYHGLCYTSREALARLLGVRNLWPNHTSWCFRKCPERWNKPRTGWPTWMWRSSTWVSCVMPQRPQTHWTRWADVWPAWRSRRRAECRQWRKRALAWRR